MQPHGIRCLSVTPAVFKSCGALSNFFLRCECVFTAHDSLFTHNACIGSTEAGRRAGKQSNRPGETQDRREFDACNTSNCEV